MKFLIAILVPIMPVLMAAYMLSLLVPAMAQTLMPTQLPTTMPLTNNKTGETIGTATIWGGRMVLRKTNGEFIAQVIIERDGTRKMLDESGKPLEQIPTHFLVPDAPKD